MGRPSKKDILRRKKKEYARTWRAEQKEKGKIMLQMWIPAGIAPAAKAAVLHLVNAHARTDQQGFEG